MPKEIITALIGSFYLFPIISSPPLAIMVIFMLMIFKVLIYAFCLKVRDFTQLLIYN